MAASLHAAVARPSPTQLLRGKDGGILSRGNHEFAVNLSSSSSSSGSSSSSSSGGNSRIVGAVARGRRSAVRVSAAGAGVSAVNADAVARTRRRGDRGRRDARVLARLSPASSVGLGASHPSGTFHRGCGNNDHDNDAGAIINNPRRQRRARDVFAISRVNDTRRRGDLVAATQATGDGDDAAAAAPSPAADANAPAPGNLDGLGDVLDIVKAEFLNNKSSSSSSPKSSAKTFAAALVALVAIHVRDPGWGIWNVIRVVGALVLGAGLAYKGYRGGALDKSGALVGRDASSTPQSP